MNKKLPAWIVLTVICLVAALALAFTYNGTKDRIAQQEEAKTVAVRQALLPAAASFEAVDGSEVYRGVDANGAAVGYVTVNTVKGFGGDVEISVAVDPEGVIQGISVGGANFKETAGLGAKSKEPAFTEQFAGKTAPVALKKNGGEIDAITAATITSSAVVRGVNDAVTMLAEKAGFTIQQAASAVEEKGNGRYATEKQGFAGPVYVELALDGEGKITEIAIGDDRFSESNNYGAKAREEAFYGQYIGKTGQLTLGQDIDAISGATITSTAVNDAVNLILLYVNDPAAYAAQQSAEPVNVGIPEGAQAYTAQAKGLTGTFPVSISVDEQGMISGIALEDSDSANDAAFVQRVQNDTAFLSQFIGQAAPFDEAAIDTVTGATVSSKAVIAAVNQAYNAAMGIAEPTAAPTAEPTEVPVQPTVAEPAEGTVVSAQGKGLTGEFPVNVTVDENNAIVKVELGDSSTETDAGFLAKVKEDANYLNQFVGKTAPVDEASIDVVAGATVSSKAVVAAINAACENLPKAEPAAEEATGMVLTAQAKGLTGEFPVNVTVDANNAIVKVELGDSSTETDAGFLAKVKEDANYLNQFVGKTAPVDEASIDVVAGATVSSKALVAAVNAACENLPEAGITVIGGADGATEIIVSENLPAAEEAAGTVLTAQGKGLTGEFPVNVTVDESNAIVKVELGDSSTDMDASFLNMVKTDANYLNQFVGKTAPVDEASIDVVAGATVSSKAVVAAVNAACENLPKAEPAAEEATGTVLTAQAKGLTGEFPVNVTVDESNAIVKVELGDSSTDMDANFLNMVKTDANYLNQFVGKTAPVDEASIDVVAGATVSSKAVVAAVNAACENLPEAGITVIGGADGATEIIVSENLPAAEEAAGTVLTAQGKGLTGEFPVNVTVDESNAIVKVELGDSSTDTDASFLNMVKTDANYLNQFVGKTASVDEASIDVVAGATVSSKAVVAAVNAACENLPAAEETTGTVLTAQAKGLTGEFPVNVTVDESNAIVKVELGDSSTDTDASFLNMVKTDANYLNQFVSKTAPVDEASIDVVAGATVSSKAVVAAVNAAFASQGE